MKYARHTPETMAEELDRARRTGSRTEIDDLQLLIANAQRPKGSQALLGTKEATNRQAQRRYGRNRTWDQSAKNPDRRAPRKGDYVRVPDGQVWLVTSVDGQMVRSDHLPGMPGFRSCPLGQCELVDAPETDPVVASAPAVVAPAPAARAEEVLYHACWDVLDNHTFTPETRDALEMVLRAYEATLEG